MSLEHLVISHLASTLLGSHLLILSLKSQRERHASFVPCIFSLKCWNLVSRSKQLLRIAKKWRLRTRIKDRKGWGTRRLLLFPTRTIARFPQEEPQSVAGETAFRCVVWVKTCYSSLLNIRLLWGQDMLVKLHELQIWENCLGSAPCRQEADTRSTCPRGRNTPRLYCKPATLELTLLSLK